MRSGTHYHNQTWSNVFLHTSANKNKKRDLLTTARPWFFLKQDGALGVLLPLPALSIGALE